MYPYFCPHIHSPIHSSFHPPICPSIQLLSFHCAGIYSISREHYLTVHRLPDIWTGCKGASSSRWKLPEKTFLLILLQLFLLAYCNACEAVIKTSKMVWTLGKLVQRVHQCFYKGINEWQCGKHHVAERKCHVTVDALSFASSSLI